MLSLISDTFTKLKEIDRTRDRNTLKLSSLLGESYMFSIREGITKDEILKATSPVELGDRRLFMSLMCADSIVSVFAFGTQTLNSMNSTNTLSLAQKVKSDA